MPFYKDHVYPHLVALLGNPKPIQKIRERIVPLAQGTVLEIGVGPGVNFPLYDPRKVSKIFALEPNPGMIRRAEEQRAVGLSWTSNSWIYLENGFRCRTAGSIPWSARLPYAQFQAWPRQFGESNGY
jgi:hypothetical protein